MCVAACNLASGLVLFVIRPLINAVMLSALVQCLVTRYLVAGR